MYLNGVVWDWIKPKLRYLAQSAWPSDLDCSFSGLQLADQPCSDDVNPLIGLTSIFYGDWLLMKII